MISIYTSASSHWRLNIWMWNIELSEWIHSERRVTVSLRDTPLGRLSTFSISKSIVGNLCLLSSFEMNLEDLESRDQEGIVIIPILSRLCQSDETPFRRGRNRKRSHCVHIVHLPINFIPDHTIKWTLEYPSFQPTAPDCVMCWPDVHFAKIPANPLTRSHPWAEKRLKSEISQIA
jgi:hypothetical protein